MEGPRFLESGDFESLAELLRLCFGGGPPTEVDAWPHVCRREPEYYDRYRVMSDNGRIVSSVGIVPMQFYIEGAVLPVGGISVVATHPDYRGRGLASGVIRSSIEIMKERGFAIAWLNGNRQLYSRFGWERAGRKYNFSFDKRSIAKLPPGSTEIRKYNGEDHFADAISALFERRPLRGVRDGALIRLLLSRGGTETYLSLDNTGVAGYVCVTRGQSDRAYAELYEYGGSDLAFQNLLRYCFDSLGLERISMASPIVADPCRSAILESASEWNLGFSGWIGSGGMIKILDLAALFEAFVPQMNRKLRESNVSFAESVSINSSDTGETATLSFSRGDGITVSKEPAEPIFGLSEHDVIQAFFGLDKARDPVGRSKLVSAVTPLDFYVSPMEMV